MTNAAPRRPKRPIALLLVLVLELAGVEALGVACSVGDLDETGKACSGDRCPSGLPCVSGRCGGAVDGSAAEGAAEDGAADVPYPNDAPSNDSLARDAGGDAALQLLGDDQAGVGADSADAGSPRAFPFVANVTGSVGRLFVRLDASNRAAVEIGLYSDDGFGRPKQLLTSGSIAVATGWVSVAVPAASVSAGTRYWIAVLSQTAGTPVLFDEDQQRPIVKGESTADAPNPVLPSSWISGQDYTSPPICAYATSF